MVAAITHMNRALIRLSVLTMTERPSVNVLALYHVGFCLMKE